MVIQPYLTIDGEEGIVMYRYAPLVDRFAHVTIVEYCD